MFDYVVQLVRDEVEAPFKAPMDLAHLFLLIGLISVMAILWSRILVRLHIEG